MAQPQQCCPGKEQGSQSNRLQRSFATFNASKAGQLALAIFSLKHFTSTVLDVATDALLIYELSPHFFGLVVLAGMFASDVLAARVFHRKLLGHVRSSHGHQKGQTVKPEDHQGWAKVLLVLYRHALKLPGPVYWIISILVLLPVLSIAVHVQALLMALGTILHSIKGQPVKEYTWTYLGCLDICRCIMVRSLLVSLIEAPVTITFTTLAYLLNNKGQVGKYITTYTFLFNVVSSMIHILLTAWDIMSSLVRTRSLRATIRELFNVGPSHADEYTLVNAPAETVAAASTPGVAISAPPLVDMGIMLPGSASMVPPAISRI